MMINDPVSVSLAFNHKYYMQVVTAAYHREILKYSSDKLWVTFSHYFSFLCTQIIIIYVIWFIGLFKRK